jgi:hypothetical protein
MDEAGSSIDWRPWSGRAGTASQEYAMGPRRYQIVVAGELSRRFAPAFEGMTVRCAGGQTAITGMVVDQSQLHGLLNRVGELELELVSVNAIGEEEPPAGLRRRRDGSAGASPA